MDNALIYDRILETQRMPKDARGLWGFCFDRRTAEQGGCTGLHGIEVGVKATRFVGPVVLLQIVGPTKPNGLKPEFGFNGERSGCAAERGRIPYAMTAAGKLRVVECIADYRDVFVGGPLIEPVRQQAIVLEVAHALKESGGHLTILVANDRFIDLHLIVAEI